MLYITSSSFCVQDHNMKIPNWRKKILKFSVTLMFFVMAIGVIVIWTLHEGGGEIMKEDGLFTFDTDELELFLNLREEENAIKLNLGGVELKTLVKDTSVNDKCENPSNKYCYVLADGTALNLRSSQMYGVQCYHVSWKNLTSFLPEDCLELNHGFWYGFVNNKNPSRNTWPIQNMQISKRAILTGHNKGIGDIYDYYWLSSTGTTFYIINDVSVQVSFNHSNNNLFCLSPISKETSSSLEYALCQGSSMKEAHIGTSKKFGLQPAVSFNNTDLEWIMDFIWDTQSLVIEDTKELIDFIVNATTSYNLSCSLIEIPLKFVSHFGDFKISSDIAKSLEELKNLKCSMLFNVFPVSSFESLNFVPGIRSKMFMENSFSDATYLQNYRDTQCAIWDLWNRNVQRFLLKELSKLMVSFSIQKFNLLTVPSVDRLENNRPSRTKELYTHWLNLLGNLTAWPNFQEATYRTQNIPSVIEISFKQVPSEKNASQICLSNSIPNLLTVSLYGYPLLVSTLDLSTMNDKVDPEILLRWLQVSTFIPAMKPPVAAFIQNKNILSYASNEILGLHKSIYREIDLQKYLVNSDQPLIRPIWWITPDPKTFTIADQFLVGDDILVAPVFCSGQRFRDIYLPETAVKSVWQHHFRNGTIRNFAAGGWLRKFHVTAFEIPYFLRKDVHPIASSDD